MLWIEERMILRTIHRMTFLSWTIISIILILSIVSGAGIQNSFTVQGEGALSRTLYSSWDSGSNGIGVGGDSSSRILTSPGLFQYQTRDTIDARVNNRYNETGYIRAEGTTIFSESLAIHETDLGQNVDVTHSGIVSNAEFDTAKFVSDANLSIGQKGGWVGSGMYLRDLNYAVDIVQSSDTDVYNLGIPTIDYGAHGREHSMISTNNSGSMNIRPEFSFIDFSDAYVINNTVPGEVVNTTNTTEEAVNTTNQTEENS